MLLRFDLGERKSKEIGKIILLKIISHNYHVRQLMLTAPVVYELKKHYNMNQFGFTVFLYKFHLLHKHLVLAIQEEKTNAPKSI